jgi:hypothetical protein
LGSWIHFGHQAQGGEEIPRTWEYKQIILGSELVARRTSGNINIMDIKKLDFEDKI